METKKNFNPENIPFQVSSIIENLLNGKENESIKENFRIRLIDIRDAIDASLNRYDEMLRERETKPVFRRRKYRK